MSNAVGSDIGAKLRSWRPVGHRSQGGSGGSGSRISSSYTLRHSGTGPVAVLQAALPTCARRLALVCQTPSEPGAFSGSCRSSHTALISSFQAAQRRSTVMHPALQLRSTYERRSPRPACSGTRQLGHKLRNGIVAAAALAGACQATCDSDIIAAIDVAGPLLQRLKVLYFSKVCIVMSKSCCFVNGEHSTIWQHMFPTADAVQRSLA